MGKASTAILDPSLPPSQAPAVVPAPFPPLALPTSSPFNVWPGPLHHELEFARQIQESLLPKTLPVLPGFSLAGYCRSARHVGGDFYDVITLSDGSVLLVIADVMGKGVPAALFAATLRTLIRTQVSSFQGPAELLARANHFLFEELSNVDMFITAQLALLDPVQRTLAVGSAGHCPVLIAGEQGGIESISPEGPPLGILAGALYAETSVSFPATGGCALLYTDGWSEVSSNADGCLGQEILEKWLLRAESQQDPAEQLKEDFLLQIGDLISTSSPHDDQTFLILSGLSQQPPSANVLPLPLTPSIPLP